MLSKRKLTLAAGVAAILISLSPVAGAEEAVTVDVSASELVLQPNMGGAGLSLTVSCGGSIYIQQEYQGTAAVSFKPVDQDGLPISDAQCKYQLLVHPVLDPALVKAAKASGDERVQEELAQLEQEQTIVAYGWFDIVDGQLVQQEQRGD